MVGMDGVKLLHLPLLHRDTVTVNDESWQKKSTPGVNISDSDFYILLARRAALLPRLFVKSNLSLFSVSFCSYHINCVAECFPSFNRVWSRNAVIICNEQGSWDVSLRFASLIVSSLRCSHAFCTECLFSSLKLGVI